MANFKGWVRWGGGGVGGGGFIIDSLMYWVVSWQPDFHDLFQYHYISHNLVVYKPK